MVGARTTSTDADQGPGFLEERQQHRYGQALNLYVFLGKFARFVTFVGRRGRIHRAISQNGEGGFL